MGFRHRGVEVLETVNPLRRGALVLISHSNIHGQSRSNPPLVLDVCAKAVHSHRRVDIEGLAAAACGPE